MIRLVNAQGVIKECPTGFSWTNLFFGIFVPLLRGDFKWAIIQFALNLITCCITAFIFPFFYNKTYIKKRLEQGYYAADEMSKHYLIGNGYVMAY